MNRLQVSDLGPIKEADITFGDLTLLVGPQASGKSILLQLYKLITDKQEIRAKLFQQGFAWGKTTKDVLSRFFGEGMSNIWSNNTTVNFNTEPLSPSLFFKEDNVLSPDAFTFYIPAQRIICLQNGWPRYFDGFDDSTPFVLKDFSETIRLFSEYNYRMYPPDNSLQIQISRSLRDNIYNFAPISVDESGKRRFQLKVGGSELPFTVWSAGQKEFMPLLLGFYYLCPTIDSKREYIRTVIIEEPEMGLHPQAIKSVMLQMLDLMHRGYQVIVSTHSPVLLELLWSVNYIKNYNGTTADLFELFSLQPDNSVEAIFKEVILSKTFATYFFDKTKEGVIVKNISTLDAGSDDPAVASWGGLTDFASRSGDVVSKLVANEE